MTNDEQKRALMYAAGDLTEEQILSLAAKIRGSRGGMAGVGKSKARTSEQARKAAKARWNKKESK